MAADQWISVMRQDYLQNFIKNGGASVKFIVPDEPSLHHQLWGQITDMSLAEGYVCATVDAADTKIHLVDKLFHAVAAQVDWDLLAYEYLSSLLADGHYRIPEARTSFNLETLASLNGLDEGEMRAVANNRMRAQLSTDYHLTREFRSAMLKLCQAQLNPPDRGGGVPETIREWLRGDLKLISALKSSGIFRKIGMDTGRGMLGCLARWCHVAGKSGLVVALDITAILESTRSDVSDGALHYSPATIMDAYEVLRQFIDSTDELQYCMIVVFAPPSFLTDEQRGVRRYDALYFRIWDEVRDRNRPNPLSTLLRLEHQADRAAIEVAAA